jgi:hypothetical protein
LDEAVEKSVKVRALVLVVLVLLLLTVTIHLPEGVPGEPDKAGGDPEEGGGALVSNKLLRLLSCHTCVTTAVMSHLCHYCCHVTAMLLNSKSTQQWRVVSCCRHFMQS